MYLEEGVPANEILQRFSITDYNMIRSWQSYIPATVKLEVDAISPASAGLEITMVRRHVVMRLQQHNQDSLPAGKLHAELASEPTSKGGITTIYSGT
ncbi:MAG: hypothetical protein KAH12_00240 [Anaerolineales bacterium]|nr:hypothetical protein [Anaerolineales bacterium]